MIDFRKFHKLMCNTIIYRLLHFLFFFLWLFYLPIKKSEILSLKTIFTVFVILFLGIYLIVPFIFKEKTANRIVIAFLLLFNVIGLVLLF